MSRYDLENALVESFKRYAATAASKYANDPKVTTVAYLRKMDGTSTDTPYGGDAWLWADSPIRQWFTKLTGTSSEAEKGYRNWSFAAVISFDQRRQPNFQAHALSPTIVAPLRDLETRVSGGYATVGIFDDIVSALKGAGQSVGDEGEQDMTYVGADGQSYPEVAARALQSVHAQHRSPYYGYIRSGINQKIYLFPTLEDTRAWFAQHIQLQPDLDYAAAFSATDLRVPITGMEHFMRSNGSGDYVGNWLPFLLGLPLGGLGGYFLRRWQEQHPGQALPLVPPGKLPAPQIPPTAVPPEPKTSGDPYIGGPWLDMIGQDYGYGGYSDGYGDLVGGPWHDIVGPWVGAEGDDAARRRSWPQTKALIQSAIDEVMNYAANFPAAAAYVWKLDPPSAPQAGRTGIIIDTGTTIVVPFSSQNEALNYLREVAQARPVALAMFDRSSLHWPNPVAWRKSDQPEHEQVIAQHVASRAPIQTSGAYIGADAAETAVTAVRRRAQQLAERRSGNVIGVIHTSKDGLWHTLAFRTADDADDWLNTATQDQSTYTYAAYFDKEGDSWPRPYIEKIGGFHTSKSQRFSRSGIVGAAIDDHRTLAKQYASRKPGVAAGAILSAEGRWRAYGFTSLDDAIDWLQQATREKTTFIYAAAFEKDRGGTVYIQDEEFGGGRTRPAPGEPIRREIATTSGADEWWAA